MESAFKSWCYVANPPGFDAKSVVYHFSQWLLAANVAFRSLHRDNCIPQSGFCDSGCVGLSRKTKKRPEGRFLLTR